MLYYSVIRLYENGISRKERFPLGSEECVFPTLINKFLKYRKQTLRGIKMIFLRFPDEDNGFVLTSLYFVNGKFAFELRRAPLANDYFVKESYFKIIDRFCEENLADYKDVLLNVEDVDVATALVTLRKYGEPGGSDGNTRRVRIDISKLQPVEVVDLGEYE